MGHLPRALARKKTLQRSQECEQSRTKLSKFKIRDISDSKMRKTKVLPVNMKKNIKIQHKYSSNYRKVDFNASMHTIMKIINSYKSINFVNNSSILCPAGLQVLLWLSQ